MPSQRHLVSLAIDCWIQVSLAKRYEVPFSPIHSERSVRGIQWFLQHFEKRALGERLRVLKMSPQHHDAVFMGVVRSCMREMMVSIC